MGTADSCECIRMARAVLYPIASISSNRSGASANKIAGSSIHTERKSDIQTSEFIVDNDGIRGRTNLRILVDDLSVYGMCQDVLSSLASSYLFVCKTYRLISVNLNHI